MKHPTTITNHRISSNNNKSLKTTTMPTEMKTRMSKETANQARIASLHRLRLLACPLRTKSLPMHYSPLRTHLPLLHCQPKRIETQCNNPTQVSINPQRGVATRRNKTHRIPMLSPFQRVSPLQQLVGQPAPPHCRAAAINNKRVQWAHFDHRVHSPVQFPHPPQALHQISLQALDTILCAQVDISVCKACEPRWKTRSHC